MSKGVPVAAAVLGGLGLIPFIGLAALALLSGGSLGALAMEALAAYGATILSFLGGVYWGFALAHVQQKCNASNPTKSGPDVDEALARENAARSGLVGRLLLGVLPQLLGWVAVLIPFRGGQALLAVALLVWLLVERRAVAQGLAPPWFLHLRLPLTLAAAVTLAAAALAG